MTFNQSALQVRALLLSGWNSLVAIVICPSPGQSTPQDLHVQANLLKASDIVIEF